MALFFIVSLPIFETPDFEITRSQPAIGEANLTAQKAKENYDELQELREKTNERLRKEYYYY